MDLDLEDLDAVTSGARVLKLSARCSVFMKSDCTHRLNKGEATKGDIALSLSKVMADKVSEFLIKAKVRAGQVALVGGVTQNRHLLRFLAEAWPQIDFVVPGAGALLRGLRRRAPGSARWASRCRPAAGGCARCPRRPARPSRRSPRPRRRCPYFPSRRGALRPEGEYILGRRRRLDDDQGGADRRRDAGDRRGPLRTDPRRPGGGAQALPGRGPQADRRRAAADHARRHHGLVARAARRLPGDGRRLQRDHRPRHRHDLLRARRRHALRDRRAGRQVRAAQQRRARSTTR